MTELRSKKKKKWLITLYIYMLIILFTLLTAATYTWFTLSQTPRVSDLNMYVNSKSGLELALWTGQEEWVQQLDFRDMVEETTELRPITWSNRDNCFYAAEYSIDGRMTGKWEKLFDLQNANKTNLDGYYVKATFYARSQQDVEISLTPAIEVDEGLMGSGTYLIGTPVWDGENIVHSNGGQGAECAVRIGIKITPVDKNGIPTGENGAFYIYEPNSDLHIDGTRGYVKTPSIDETETLVPSDYLILQSASTWTEAEPVQRSVVIRDLGDFTTETKLWDLKAEDVIQIDLYVWLEGQDIDCTNMIEKAQILANIQFNGDAGQQSGMVTIE